MKVLYLYLYYRTNTGRPGGSAGNLGTFSVQSLGLKFLHAQQAVENDLFVCVCVCVFSSHSFWTSSSLDVPAGVTQEEGHTGFLHLPSAVLALIFLARRIQPFVSLAEFCVLTI